MKLARNIASILIIACLVFAAPDTALAALKVIVEPGSDLAHVAMVQKTVDAFNDIISVEMGVTLDRDVSVFICPTRESYRDVLKRELRQSAETAERLSTLTGGLSVGSANAVAIKFDLPAGASAGRRAYQTTAHELFHQLQYQLAGNKMGKSYYWMKEGTADLIGAAVAEKVGYQSMEKWKLDQVNVLRKANNPVSSLDILHTDFNTWTKFAEQKRNPYQMADLMVFYLMNQTKAGNYRSIAEYYRLLGQGLADEAAFERAFGLSGAGIVNGFQGWFAGIVKQSATIEVIAGPEVPAEYLGDFRQGVDLTRNFFTSQWGRDVNTSMRFVLVSGKPAFALAAVKEFGFSQTEAEQRVKNITWLYSGSTTICDTKVLPAKPQRIFSVAGSLARRFAYEAAPQKSLEQLYWLATGSGEAVAASVVELSGAYTIDQYRTTWLNNVSSLPTRPALAELASGVMIEQAKAKYGATAVIRLSALGALYLLDKYGAASFNTWYNAVKETGDAEASFQRVYGITVYQFYDEFGVYLQQNLKKAA